MPSLHVGWALIIAIACRRALTSRWRNLIALYPAAMALTVVVTGHHYWLDGIVATLIVAAVYAAIGRSGDHDRRRGRVVDAMSRDRTQPQPGEPVAPARSDHQ